MAPYDGRAGEREGLQGGGVGCVGEVDEHAEAVHFVDEGVAERTRWMGRRRSGVQRGVLG